jgi:hypothetical protein
MAAMEAGGMGPPLTSPIVSTVKMTTHFRLMTLGTGKLSAGDAFGKIGCQRKGSEAVVGSMSAFGEIRTDDKLIAWMGPELLRAASRSC